MRWLPYEIVTQNEYDTKLRWIFSSRRPLLRCPSFYPRCSKAKLITALLRALIRPLRLLTRCELAGAASLCVFWGPVVGASVVTYRTALFLEVGCQVLGNIAFGPRYLLPYAGVLKDRDFSIVASSPELVIYSLLCVAVVLPVWHLAAFWERVPMPPPTGLGNLSIKCCTVLLRPERLSIPILCLLQLWP